MRLNIFKASPFYFSNRILSQMIEMQLTMVQTPIIPDGKHSFGIDVVNPILGVFWKDPNEPLKEFSEMWYNVFLWALFSSLLIHSVAAIIAFLTLRKHAVGRYMNNFIL